MAKTIVVPLDGSAQAERAAPIAAALAGRLGAEVLLVAVSSLREQSERDLERATRDGGFDARIEIVDASDVPAAIGGVVEQVSEPALCMATHGRGRVGHTLLGSVAEELLREVSVPFVLVGPHCAAEWPADEDRMLACVDESATSNAILDPAAEWAKGLGLELWLTEVFHPLDVESIQAPYRFLDTVVERLRPELPSVKACALWSSHAQGEILHLARSLSVSMIAMGTHGRSGLARVALGSVAMGVVHQARCPVLTVRPADLS